jgi:ubiquinone/menaquinone biosynthesis C-methylase UbiE
MANDFKSYSIDQSPLGSKAIDLDKSFIGPKVRSPCCCVLLAGEGGRALVCQKCCHSFPLESFGPDLMPPSVESRYPSFSSWCSVQEALAAWRKRTWDGSARAAQKTRSNETTAEDFIGHFQPSGQILDIGCGSGWMGRLYAERGCEYAGIDPQPLQPSFSFPFIRAVSDCLPFADESFDACAFHSSIDYSLSIETTLVEAFRVLRPGGRLGIATPIHGTKEPVGERLHHYRFLEGELERLVSEVLQSPVEIRRYHENFVFMRTQKSAPALMQPAMPE